ncbi:MAG: LysM peptidoglycan-binding domain-containing protein [Lacinutrix sp.]|uniref:LysM peptidoglycan-binding domain-containing protein n=1 Tax=Lacinutrix sp. TaxID=1937692 RepID=UPI00309B9106
MKKIMLAFVCLISLAAFSQNTIVDVIIDGKPHKLNTTIGVYTFTKGSPTSYNKTKSIQDTVTVSSDSRETKPSSLNLDTKLHTVSKGETLYAISNNYGISIAHIKSLNKLKSNIIAINQKLKIRYSETAEIKETSGLYLVKKGDTLFSIAKQHNITVQELKTLNNLENNSISIGQELTIK